MNNKTLQLMLARNLNFIIYEACYVLLVAEEMKEMYALSINKKLQRFYIFRCVQCGDIQKRKNMNCFERPYPSFVSAKWKIISCRHLKIIRLLQRFSFTLFLCQYLTYLLCVTIKSTFSLIM